MTLSTLHQGYDQLAQQYLAFITALAPANGSTLEFTSRDSVRLATATGEPKLVTGIRQVDGSVCAVCTEGDGVYFTEEGDEFASLDQFNLDALHSIATQLGG